MMMSSPKIKQQHQLLVAFYGTQVPDLIGHVGINPNTDVGAIIQVVEVHLKVGNC